MTVTLISLPQARRLLAHNQVMRLHVIGIAGGWTLQMETAGGRVTLANRQGLERLFVSGEALLTYVVDTLAVAVPGPLSVLHFDSTDWAPKGPRSRTRPDRAEPMRQMNARRAKARTETLNA